MKVLAERPPQISRRRACEALCLSRTGTYRRPARPRKTVHAPQPRALTPEQRETVRALFEQECYLDSSVRTIYALELSEGRMHGSVSTYYRILREDGQSRERRAQRPPQRHAVPRIRATAPNQAWSWDITKLPTWERGKYLNLYMVLDLFSRFPVGWMISQKENGALAVHMFRQIIEQHRIQPEQLVIHQDRGAPMIAESFADLMRSTGITRSYSRPRVSNDNAFSEAQFKTLKYAADYPRRFQGVEHARTWTGAFIERYRRTPHTGLGLHTPEDVFQGRVEQVNAVRQGALEAYWQAYPERFVHRPPKAGLPPAEVTINPEDGLSADELLRRPIQAETCPEPVTIPEVRVN